MAEEVKKEDIIADETIPEESKGLTEIKSIGPKTALKLIDAGIATPQQIACCRYEELAEILKISKKAAKDIVNDAMNKYLDKTITLGNFGTITAHFRDIVKRIPTGSTVFDKIMKGGIPTEAITIFKGEFASGKSEICYQLTANALKYFKGCRVVWIATESGTFVPDRLNEISKAIGIKVADDDIIYIDSSQITTPWNLYLSYQRIDKYVTENNLDVKLWVIDSFSAPFRKSYGPREMLPDRSREENRHLGFLDQFAKKNNTAIVLTAQVMDIPDPGAQLGEMVKSGHKKKMVGGKVLEHGGTYLISLEQKAMKQWEGIIFDAPDIARTAFRFQITGAGVRDI